MKSWLKYGLGIALGLAGGAAAAWTLAGQGMGRTDFQNGPWTTSLGFGTAETDNATRASVARRGLLALPSTETVYWQAVVDDAGQPLDGKCRYALSGGPVDARWWSVTLYDTRGYLIANPADVWSFNGLQAQAAPGGQWRVTVGPDKPGEGVWLPSDDKQPFHLTLRMYNPGKGVTGDPRTTKLPSIKKEACA